MFNIKIIFVTFTIVFTKICFGVNYRNYTLYRGMPISEKDLEFFVNMSYVYQVNFWRPPSTVNRPIEFVLAPEEQSNFKNDAQNAGVYLTTIIPDLQIAFDKQIVRSYVRRNMESFDWRSFYRLKDIYIWLKDLQATYPKDVKVFSIGKTYERRDIMAVKISLRGTKKRSIVIVEGGAHAREWISSAFVTFMIYQIIRAPQSDDGSLREIAMSYEWYFVPVLNPDGYEFTHTRDRMWRKNRVEGHGVDINRNFGYRFGTVGVSKNMKSDIYCGPKAFSENESRAMAALVKSKGRNIEYYLGFHAYGQYMIIPYAHSRAHVENFDKVKSMGMEAAKKLSRRFGTSYSVGTAYDTVGYATSGVSGCWVKKTYSIPYVIMFELRDNGEYGFALPANQILPTCLETMDGLISFLEPQSVQFSKLKREELLDGGQENLVLDRIIIICNVLLFIIVRFD